MISIWFKYFPYSVCGVNFASGVVYKSLVYWAILLMNPLIIFNTLHQMSLDKAYLYRLPRSIIVKTETLSSYRSIVNPDQTECVLMVVFENPINVSSNPFAPHWRCF